MEGLRSDSDSCRTIASRLGDERFTLIDVGCSGGIDQIWRVFGPRLRAFGFDPTLEECKRLNAAETFPGVRYVAAFVGLPADHPVVLRRGAKSYVQKNPWNRLSVPRSVAVREARRPQMSTEEKMALNQWNKTSLADPNAPVVLPAFFKENGVDDIDMLKIDVDGPDFDILQSAQDSIRDLNVLAAGLEVNFCGTHEDTDHTFHNTDRLMRSLGFDLFFLTVRPYSNVALPSRYQLAFPAQTVTGRPLQGDALYVRDLGDPEREEANGVKPAKLAKLAAIFACFGLYDCAAEVLLTHRARLAAMLDVDRLLDQLAAEAQAGSGTQLSYRDYKAAFENDAPLFYPPA